ncbi:MAG: hypothetical protein IKP86_10610 [Anaerolineaceae bacterium]|nr:hypothetical protein [Anaerolineaceae bacterium]
MKNTVNTKRYSMTLEELVERLEKHAEKNHGTPLPDDERDRKVFKAGYDKAVEDILFLLA